MRVYVRARCIGFVSVILPQTFHREFTNSVRSPNPPPHTHRPPTESQAFAALSWSPCSSTVGNRRRKSGSFQRRVLTPTRHLPRPVMGIQKPIGKKQREEDDLSQHRRPIVIVVADTEETDDDVVNENHRAPCAAETMASGNGEDDVAVIAETQDSMVERSDETAVERQQQQQQPTEEQTVPTAEDDGCFLIESSQGSEISQSQTMTSAVVTRALEVSPCGDGGSIELTVEVGDGWMYLTFFRFTGFVP